MEQLLIQMSTNRWRVLQPAIYLVSVLPTLACGFIFEAQSSIGKLVWVGSAVVLIQHAINVFNDETDWQKGADGEKLKSWYHFHQGNLRDLRRHAWISLILGLGLGIGVVVQANRPEVLWAALPLVGLGLLYNHSRWTLSYTHWGEWVTGICYGPGVFGCMAYLISGELSIQLVIGSIAFASLAVSVLLSHQPPQVLTDFAAGKNSFAVRHGAQKTYSTARVLLLVCAFLISLLFSMEAKSEAQQFVSILYFVFVALTLPLQLSPALILRATTIQLVLLRILTGERWL